MKHEIVISYSEDPLMNYILQSRERYFQPPNPTEPTSAKPGSVEKRRVMTERYRAGQPLHHPSDDTCLSGLDRARNFTKVVDQN